MLDLKKLPSQPGIYRFLDAQGRLLYIGKAKNLKNRLKSYFVKSADLSPAKKIMMEKIKKIEFTIVTNEIEALLLEKTLIKKHQPPFNVDLKDDKYWQYIKITLDEPYPRVITVRKINHNLKSKTKDRPRYFGPYMSSQSVKQILRLLKKIFPYRVCERDLSVLPRGKVCLQYHLNRCLGPCEMLCAKKEYDLMIKRIIDFLSGKTEGVINDLRQKMEDASAKKEYEKAGVHRDQLQALGKLTIRQKVISTKQENHDYLNLYRSKNTAIITLFKVRQGKLLDQLNFTLKKTALFSEAELLEDFAEQYYSQTTDLPKKIIVPVKIQIDKKTIVPTKGDKKKLLDLAKVNAEEYHYAQAVSWEKRDREANKKLMELQKVLNLTELPKRIEGYDISNIGGQEAVGSMAVMTDGKIDKNEYRKFKIKTIKGANDPAMIGEIIKRRLNNDWPKPNLILIDGGPTQLNAALNQLDKNKILIISLAKRQEEIYLPNEKLPIKLPKFSPALQLLQQLRDEAHRFAISYHRKMRRKKLIDKK